MAYYSPDLYNVHLDLKYVTNIHTGEKQQTPNGVTLTGWYEYVDGGAKLGFYLKGSYFEFEDGNFYLITSTTLSELKNGQYKPTETADTGGDWSLDRTRQEINEIIKNNRNIFDRNVKASGMLYWLNQRGKLSYGDKQYYIAQIKALQKRLEERNQAIIDSGLVKVEKTGSTRYQNELQYLTSIRDNGRIGMATWAVVLIAVAVTGVVTAGATYGIQYWLSKRAQSLEDVKLSEDMIATLQAKLTPEEWDQFQREYYESIKEAYNLGARDNKSGIGSVLGKVAIGAGVFFLVKLLIDKK